MSQAKRAGPPRARHIRVGGCLRRNGPDHLLRGISEPRVSRISQAKWAGPPLARHLRTQSCEDVSGETRRTISRTASQS
eukprot:1980885-Pyramimonas_sp.AAC.1